MKGDTEMETEWTKQAEDMFKTWTEAQKRLWDDWLKGMQGLGRSQPLEAWVKTAEAWEDSVRESLKVQVEWTKLWAEGFTAVKGTPKEMTEWARQGQEMITQWAETQKRLWEDWLDLVKKLRPSGLTGNWEREGQKFAQTWQEGIQRALDAQADWVRVWTVGQAGDRTREKSKGAGA